jgi:hypothetical protein
MDRLPLEVIFQILEYLPLSNYNTLYSIFPQSLIDEALIYKLRNNKRQPVMDLISTNLHELSANAANQRNESSLPLFYASFDHQNRFIWTLPNFTQQDYFFRVKDAYVSHGKLVIRRPHDDDINKKSLLVSSLWDIRKSFPPTRAGSFSGASEYISSTKMQELTMYQSGCILDSCLIFGHNHHNTEMKQAKHSDDVLKRPCLPSTYQRQIPSTKNTSLKSCSSFFIPTYPDPTCGYFLVERLAISIPNFLELFY